MATSSCEVSSAGPLMISTCWAFGAGGGFCAATGMQKSRPPPATAVIARSTPNLFIEQTRYCSTWTVEAQVWGPSMAPVLVPVLWYRRRRHRRDAADIRRARKLSQAKGRDQGLIALVRCRLTRQGGRALTGEGIDVLIGADSRVGWVVTIGQCLQEGDDLVLLRV